MRYLWRALLGRRLDLLTSPVTPAGSNLGSSNFSLPGDLWVSQETLWVGTQEKLRDSESESSVPLWDVDVIISTSIWQCRYPHNSMSANTQHEQQPWSASAPLNNRVLGPEGTPRDRPASGNIRLVYFSFITFPSFPLSFLSSFLPSFQAALAETMDSQASLFRYRLHSPLTSCVCPWANDLTFLCSIFSSVK